MELKVGMYVRTKFGISKIIEDGNVKIIKSDNEETYDVDKNGRHYPTQFRDYIWTSDVIKASHNIIDLIEVGDVISTNNLCGQVTCIDGDKIYTTCYDGECCYDYQIQSIVTKQQFSSMEYRLGE